MTGIDLDKFDAVLDMNDPQFAEKLGEAIGVKPGETLHITTPQFERTDGLVVPIPDVDFARIADLPVDTLKALGCAQWDEPDATGNVLWLYPAEWYDHIPEGLPVTCIDGEVSPFKRGETDDDRRFGVLAYGFVRQEKPAA